MVIHTRKIGGGYREAFFNSRVLDFETGKPVIITERVLGGGLYPELEIQSRLRIRFPNQRITLKAVN